MVGLRSAVGDLREALAALANNGSVAEDGVLRLNVREARTSLNRRLAQLSPATFNTMVGFFFPCSVVLSWLCWVVCC
jgi:hypothetical protein